MFVISGGKGTGKTRALIEKVVAENGILVCENPAVIRNRAHKYGITGLNLLSYEDFCETANYTNPIFIHNINSFLAFRYPAVNGYSLNVDE